MATHFASSNTSTLLPSLQSSSSSSSSSPQQSPPPVSLDTLDEPVSATILRDLEAIVSKLRIVCFPVISAGSSSAHGSSPPPVHDWDLWGPLLLCMSLAITMALSGDTANIANVFTAFFSIFWTGAAVATVNAKLLGARLSFLQSVCVLGYSMFPILASAIVSALFDNLALRALVALVCLVWSSTVSARFLRGTNLDNKVFLAMYPIYLLYFLVSWMVLAVKIVSFGKEK